MLKNNSIVPGAYVSPAVKIALLRTRRNILSVSREGQYGGQGSAGNDGSYESYNEDDDL